ncbi:tigger transposable element-derived protein 1 [Biomphalaria glabrata]|nr:tigger transposable element-derived protein 1 [Biomphalaria glabrata]
MVTTLFTTAQSDLLASHGEELSAEDLIQLEKQMIEEEEDIPTPEPKRFTKQGLAGGFSLIEEGLSRFEAEDPNMERYTRVARVVIDSLRLLKLLFCTMF